MKKLVIFIVITSFILSGILYSQLPDQVPIHWNAEGVIDDTAHKSFGAFLMPVILAFLLLLYWGIPKIAVFKKNLEKSINAYDGIFLALFSFMFIIHLGTLLIAMGANVRMDQLVFACVVILFYYIGVLLKDVKRNFFMGIRTPWTLSSDYVWKKTHNLGSITFKINAVIIAISIFTPYKVMIILISVFGNVAVLFTYSYLIFSKYNKNELDTKEVKKKKK